MDALEHASYRLRALRHKPLSLDAIEPEVRRLAAQGLRPRDIGAALGLHIDIVLRVLGPPAGAARVGVSRDDTSGVTGTSGQEVTRR